MIRSIQVSKLLHLKHGFILRVHVWSVLPLRQSYILLDCPLIQLNFDLTAFSILQSLLSLSFASLGFVSSFGFNATE